MVEAAGVELQRRVFSNVVTARGFWLKALISLRLSTILPATEVVLRLLKSSTPVETLWRRSGQGPAAGRWFSEIGTMSRRLHELWCGPK